MRRFVSLFMLAALAMPTLTAKRVDTKQVDQVLAESKNESDAEVAHRLAGLQLGERASAAQLVQWRKAAPGLETQRAVTMLADASAFLRAPAGEIVQAAPPDEAAQHQMLSLTSAYVETTLAKLPNFFASESITTFEDTPASQNNGNFTVYQPLHYADFKRAAVLYRGGKEVMETQSSEVSEQDQTITLAGQLLSSGEFGPVLHTVLADAQSGKLTWSHWESIGDTKAAVFRYSVPRKRSHYRLKVELAGHSNPMQSRPGYHGEIAIDPSGGAILRITLQADITDDDPMRRADLMVEYGPVVIGSQTYICPARSVALTQNFQEKDQVDARGFLSRSNDVPVQMMLNDVRFDHYHVLRSEARLLTGADIDDDASKPDSPQ